MEDNKQIATVWVLSMAYMCTPSLLYIHLPAGSTICSLVLAISWIYIFCNLLVLIMYLNFSVYKINMIVVVNSRVL